MPTKKPTKEMAQSKKMVPGASGVNTVRGGRDPFSASEDGPATAATALAFVVKLGLTEHELRAAVTAKEVPRDVLLRLAKVSVRAIADAFTPEVVGALLASGSSIRLKPQHLQVLAECAKRTRDAASVDAKLGAAAVLVEQGARKDASTLDEIVHLVMPQITSQSAVDDGLSSQYESVLAYWSQRYPGPPKKSSKAAATPPAK